MTNGRRPKKIAGEIQSIRRLGIPRLEILVAGAVPDGLDGIVPLPMPESAAAGRLGEMRMALAERARWERIVVCDDDIVFLPGFRSAIERHGLSFDAMGVRVLNPDGSRYWDWCTIGDARGHRLLRYDEAGGSGVYLSGAINVLRREVALRVGWNPRLRFYQAEDVDFSRRLLASGHRITFCREARVLHDDVRYRQHRLVVRRHEGPRGWKHRAYGRLLRPATLARGRAAWLWRLAGDQR